MKENPEETLIYLEGAAKEALKSLLVKTDEAATEELAAYPDFQVILRSDQLCHSLRGLTSDHVNKLVKVLPI